MQKWSEICNFELILLPFDFYSNYSTTSFLIFLVVSYQTSLSPQRIVIADPVSRLEMEQFCVCVLEVSIVSHIYFRLNFWTVPTMWYFWVFFHWISMNNQLVNVFFDYSLPSSTWVQVLLIGAIYQLCGNRGAIYQLCGNRGHECMIHFHVIKLRSYFRQVNEFLWTNSKTDL